MLTKTSISKTTNPEDALRSCLKPSFSTHLEHNEAEIEKNEPKPSAPTNNKPCENRRRTVSFRPKVIVKKTMHINDYTNKEYRKCFYTEKDYKVIGEMFQITQQFLALGHPEDLNVGLCFRGVKEQTREELIRRARTVQRVTNTVLAEQKHQRKTKKNAEYMADICRSQSVRSQKEALARAQQDAQAVQDLLKSGW